MIKLYGYKKCGTCRKAEKYLNDNKISYSYIDITLNPPSSEQLQKIVVQSKKDLKKFFNTSGIVYREMQLKNKLKDMSDSDMLMLLAENGKLIKRPILTNGTQSSVGYNDDEFQKIWK